MTAEARVPQALARSKLFWIGMLYFAEGFPLGMFYDVFPVYFRRQGVELKSLGVLSLLGLAWTLKFIWAPAIDYFRHHRRIMALVDAAMAAVMIWLAANAGFGPAAWLAIGLFALLSATNDIAIDGYSIELLDKGELGLANGVRIGMYRVGMLASGAVLMLADLLDWHGAFVAAAAVLLVSALACLTAPREAARAAMTLSLRHELRLLRAEPLALLAIGFLLTGSLWLVDNVTRWSSGRPGFWPLICALAAAPGLTGLLAQRPTPATGARGPLFGALLSLLARPNIMPVLAFILVFKLTDAAIGFMVKPFWVDAGFSNQQIGLVSVNFGLGLSIAGGLVGGWYTDRVGIFRALWVLGLTQGLSNFGYAIAAWFIPIGGMPQPEHQWMMYGASALESFTGGLGTAAFLAFLMAIVNKQHAATEYALLSSVFALSRSLAGWVSGYGVHGMGYAGYFALTGFLILPAFLFLPWVKRALHSEGTR